MVHQEPEQVVKEGLSRRALTLLSRVAEDLAGEFELEPLLERILRSVVMLLDSTSGSMSLIDLEAGTYHKALDLDSGCSTGQVFPLDEGLTGLVARRGCPVILRRYGDVDHGHIGPGEERYHRAAIGVPIRRKGTMIGAVVVFAASNDQRFNEDDALLLQAFATHAAISMTNARLYEAASEQGRRAAIAAERERSLQEVNDTIGRSLTSVLVTLDEARGRVEPGTSEAQALAIARQAAVAALEDGRRVVLGLQPVTIPDEDSLEDTIRRELAWVEATTGVATTLRVFGSAVAVSPEIGFQVRRVVQEALTNVTQHSGATNVRVGLVHGEEDLTVIIEDDGVGFDAEHMHLDPGSGLGLAGLVTRTAQVGGSLQIDSTCGWGTRVRAQLPHRPTPPRSRQGSRVDVVVCHPQDALRAGLVRVLEQNEPGIRVVAESATVAAALQAIKLAGATVVVTGCEFPHLAGAELMHQLRSACPDTAVVAMVGRTESDATLRALAAAGARGFVRVDGEAPHFARAVMAAARGDALVYGHILQHMSGEATSSNLTARESEVLELVTQGLADKQIATRLRISVKTVEKHVSSLLRKEGVHNRTELVSRRLMH